LLHTAGLGFMVGIDIYDCVVVINTEKALEAFTKIRCTLGGEISVAAGPVGAGAILETELHKRQAPVYNYMKSRGFYAGVQIDGSVVIERTDENERFYGEKIPVQEILAGKVRHPPYELRQLMETIKAAQGDNNYDESVIPSEPPPGDYVVDDGHMFGIPEKDDPDPYGVLALEKEGLSLKEAGTQKRASWQDFSFQPSPTSPVRALYEKEKVVTRRNSWRASTFSNAEPKTPSSLRHSLEVQPKSPSMMSDMATQTDFPDPPSPSRWSARSGRSSRRSSQRSLASKRHSQMQEVPEHKALDTSPDRKVPENVSKVNGYSTPPHTPPIDNHAEEGAEFDDEEDAHIEEPVVHSIQTVQPVSPQVVSKARLVTVHVPKRPPPKLPPRNPHRGGGPLVIDASPKPGTPEEQDSVAAKVADLDGTTDKLTDIKLEDRENMDDVALGDVVDAEDVKSLEDEDVMPNPWAKVEEARKRETMPGGFE